MGSGSTRSAVGSPITGTPTRAPRTASSILRATSTVVSGERSVDPLPRRRTRPIDEAGTSGESRVLRRGETGDPTSQLHLDRFDTKAGAPLHWSAPPDLGLLGWIRPRRLGSMRPYIGGRAGPNA